MVIRKLSLLGLTLAALLAGGCGDRDEAEYRVNATVAPEQNRGDDPQADQD